MYILFGLCRLLFLLFNFRYFSISGPAHFFQWLWGGLVFDTVAILYVNVLYIVLATIPLPFRYRKWYETILSVLFVITNSIAIAANITRYFLLSFYIDAGQPLPCSGSFQMNQTWERCFQGSWSTIGMVPSFLSFLLPALYILQGKPGLKGPAPAVWFLLLRVCPCFNAAHLYSVYRGSEGWL